MSSKPNHLEQSTKRRDPAFLRKKNERHEPIFMPQKEDSPLFLPGSIQGSRRPQVEVVVQELHDEGDLFLPKTNRIYNSGKGRNIQSYRGGSKGPNPRASLNNLVRDQEADWLGDKLQDRPQSSLIAKQKNGSQIFKNKNDMLNYENRPGSSKSSRLFKRKGPFANDTINSENEEGEPVIRVTGLASSRLGTSYIKGKDKGPSVGRHNRVGTSLPQGQRGVEKIPAKIDPDFFRLFAQ